MDPNLPADLATIVRVLVERHRCHAVILYGSRARGEEHAASDYDLAVIREGKCEERDTRAIDGLDPFALDAFVYGEESLVNLKPDMERMHGGRTLLDERGQGAALLARIEGMVLAGPNPLPAWEIELQGVWSQKMLARIAAGGMEGGFRRVQLLNDFPEIYFKRRALRTRGIRAMLEWLREHDRQTHDALERALDPGCDAAALRALVERMLSASA